MENTLKQSLEERILAAKADLAKANIDLAAAKLNVSIHKSIVKDLEKHLNKLT